MDIFFSVLSGIKGKGLGTCVPIPQVYFCSLKIFLVFNYKMTHISPCVKSKNYLYYLPASILGNPTAFELWIITNDLWLILLYFQGATESFWTDSESQYSKKTN